MDFEFSDLKLSHNYNNFVIINKWSFLKKFLVFFFIFTSGCQSNTLYQNINFEIVAMKGAEPDPEALNFFAKKLEKYHLYKSCAFWCRSKVAPAYVWLSGNIEHFEYCYRTSENTELDADNINIFIAYLSGPYGDPKTLLGGLQYDDSIAIFRYYTGNAEGSMLMHEFGHLIGVASNKNHPNRIPFRPDRPNHCNNKDCIMFYQVSRDDDKNAGDFDEECLKDLKLIFNKKS